MKKIPNINCAGAFRTNAKKKVAARTPRSKIGKSGSIQFRASARQAAVARRRTARRARGNLRLGFGWIDLCSWVSMKPNRALECSRSHQPIGRFRRTPSPLSVERLHASRKRCNPAQERLSSVDYSAWTIVMGSAGTVIGLARRMKRNHAVLISRNSRTHALGAWKWEANCRSISSGRQ